MSTNWKSIAEKKREAVFDKIPKEWVIQVPPSVKNSREYLDEVLPSGETEVINQSLVTLAAKIAKGELSSVEVTTAFCHRAALAHQMLNCCAEIFFEKALLRAKELDEYYAKHGKTLGPLHGVPISLKDQINLEGLDSAIGLLSKVNHPKAKDEESLIATILYDAGAVFYVKTTTPMAMMACDTYSNIYGQTVNAYNRALSSGGSSGGEGALIGAKGSLIGLSTDIGGSIRVPALFQGLFAIRPSSNRLPYLKVENSMSFQPIVPSVIGPSAQYLEDIKYFIKVIIDATPWVHDPKVPPIPWREYEVPKKLAFGIFKDNKVTHTHPPIARAIDLVKEKLLAIGHEVIEWDPPVDALYIQKNLNEIFVSDGYKEIKEECAKTGEPLIKQLLYGDHIGEELKCSEQWEQGKKKYEAQQKYDSYWLETAKKTSTGRPVDAFISPGWESTSHIAGDPQKFVSAYTYPSNYLDYSTAVFPVTFVDKSIDKPYTEFEPYTENDKKINETYDPELFDGMPVSLQLIAPRYEEERALELAGIVYGATH